MRGLIGSNVYLARHVPDLVAAPVLYKGPVEGWHLWAAQLTGQAVTKSGTHSGNLVAAHAPGWSQWLALKGALMAADESGGPAAELRRAFEAGQPLSILPPNSVERFASFVPIVHFEDAQRYELGAERQLCKAADHAEALDKAAVWFNERRSEEIAEQRARAERLAAQLPVIYVDLAVLQLQFDGLLSSCDGDLMAMLNGPHGFYLVSARCWCYCLERVVPGVAGKLAALAAVEDRTPLLLCPASYPVFAGLDGWAQKPGGYRWAEGRLNELGPGQWRIRVGDRSLALVEIAERQVQLLGARRSQLLTSSIPVQWGADPGAVLAWATWRALRLARGRL